MEYKLEDRNTISDYNTWTRAICGDSIAQLELGNAYFRSDFTPSNFSNGFKWISWSAQQGNLEAQFRLGDLYALGWGTKQCRTSAYDWYTKAAIQGYKKALIRINNLYQEDIRIRCRGQLNSGDRRWDFDLIKKKLGVRELNEFRLRKYKSILNGVIDYYTNQFNKCRTSNQDDPEIQQNLGFLYQHGYGVKKYTKWAIEYYLKAAEKGLVAAQYNLAFLYQYNTKIKFNYRKALYWYSLAANSGNIAAQNSLAYFYEKGLATDIDYQQALLWYTKAANADNSEAQLTLGKWYRKGECIQQDITMSFKWYNLTAKQGNQVAQNCLDLLYQNGKIVDLIDKEKETPKYSTEESRKSRLCSKLRLDIKKIDNPSKVKQFRKLATHAFRGDRTAMYEIGLNYYNGNTFNQDKEISLKWIRNAADAGHNEAQLKLAELYKQGDIIEQDYHKASIWTKKLAKSKNDIGQYNLGMLYKEGLGVRHDILESSKWFIFSADQENSDAMYELGDIEEYYNNFGGSSEEAIDWYYKSFIRGNINACYCLGNMYLGSKFPTDNHPVKKNINKAVKMLDYAAKNGHPSAQFKLGDLYTEGSDITQDQSKANEYYSMMSDCDIYDLMFTFFVAIKYLNGDPVDQDKIKAFQLFKKAAKTFQISRHIFQIPVIYERRINYYKLVDMFIEITKRGIDSMEYNIGYIYEHGVYSDTIEELFVKNYKNAVEWYSASATKGDSRAYYRLGIIHEEGRGIEKNVASAISYYEKAAELNHVDAKYRLACMSLMGCNVPQNKIKAFYLFTNAANMSHLNSRKALLLPEVVPNYDPDLDENSPFYSVGFTLIQDTKIPITELDQLQMLEAMAEQDLVAVQYQLGQIYLEKDDPRAFKWLVLAVQGGISDACYRLGVLYEEGKYTKNNYSEAIKLYKIAAEGDHEDALYRLAGLYHYGKGTPIDYIEGYNLYFRAFEMGHSLASKMLNITGDLNKATNGTTEKNRFDTISVEFNQSLLMCEYVAERGNTELQYKLGTVYEKHRPKPDYQTALKWYKMASSNSHKGAIYRLGLLYEKGLGVNLDYKKAIRLFEKAKDLNNSDAIFKLATLYHYGNGIGVDPIKSIKYYKLSASLGNPLYQYKLGELYQKGELVTQNNLEALKWYTKAYTQGYDTARPNLYALYEDIAYEDYFHNKLFKLLETIVTTSSETKPYTEVKHDNLLNACCRLGYWYCQREDFERAWQCFSKTCFENRYIYSFSVGFLENQSISSQEKQEILNTLEIDNGLVDKLDGDILFYIGMHYDDEFTIGPKKYKIERGKVNANAFGYGNINIKNSNTIKQDYSKAFVFFEKASKKDNSGAQYTLGSMYQHGHGVDIDIKKAQEWYDKAGSSNDCVYAYYTGIRYHCDGPMQNFSKAYEMYDKVKAAFSPTKYSAYQYTGLLYQYGSGVEKNNKKAIENYEEAEYSTLRYFYLASLYYNTNGDIQDYSRAFHLFQKFIKRMSDEECDYKGIIVHCTNDPHDNGTKEQYSFTLEPTNVFYGEAHCYLGIMYKNGHGTVANELKSKQHFLKAVEYGDERAREFV